MAANVHIPPTLRRFTDGAEQVEVEGRTLRQVIDALDRRFPGLREQLVKDDMIRSGLAFAIDDDMAESGLVATVPDGATILILPAIGGG
jgi:molybdopterin synthase sulfur carrier subunit